MGKKSKAYAFNRVLVALDDSELDAVLMATVIQFSKAYPIESVYFLHVARSLELPEGIQEKYPDLAPADETIEHNIKQRLAEDCPLPAGVDSEVMVVEGDPTDKLLRFIKTKKIDLLLAGRKSTLKGSGTTPNKLVKVAPCSMLFVPETMPNPVKRILVPLDFSDHSRFALDKAILLGKAHEGEVICQSVVPVPSGYHTTGKSREEFGLIMQSHAEKEYEHFMKSVDAKGVTLRPVFETNDDNNPADEIWERAESEKANLIVLGSKGRKGLSSVLLGSVASRVLDFAKNLPVLVVKDKSEGLNFLQALLRL